MKLSIVLSLLTEQQEYQRLQAEDAKNAAARVDVDLQVLFAENNLVRQIHQLLAAISAPKNECPAAIVVEAFTIGGLERAARNAASVGIGWVQLSARPPYMESLRREYPAIPLATVSVDNEKIGETQADQFSALLPNGGNVLYIQGPSLSASTIDRRRGMERRLSAKVKVLKALSADWTEAGAERMVAAWLERVAGDSSRPDLVGAQNDEMAMGAQKAILTARPHWAKMPFTGCDGLVDRGQRLVRERVLAATVVKPPEAGTAVELVARALRGGQYESEVMLAVRSVPAIQDLARVGF